MNSQNAAVWDERSATAFPYADHDDPSVGFTGSECGATLGTLDALPIRRRAANASVWDLKASLDRARH